MVECVDINRHDLLLERFLDRIGSVDPHTVHSLRSDDQFSPSLLPLECSIRFEQSGKLTLNLIEASRETGEYFSGVVAETLCLFQLYSKDSQLSMTVCVML